MADRVAPSCVGALAAWGGTAALGAYAMLAGDTTLAVATGAVIAPLAGLVAHACSGTRIAAVADYVVTATEDLRASLRPPTPPQ